MIFYYDTLPLYHNDVNKKKWGQFVQPCFRGWGVSKNHAIVSKMKKISKNIQIWIKNSKL
jgi:hypothetical protein